MSDPPPGDSPESALRGGHRPAAGSPPTSRRWSLSQINFWLDAVALICVCFVGWVSAMLQVVFPKPTQAAGWSLWGWDYDVWNRAQFAAVCLCGFVILVHVMLHWNWVCNMVASKVLRLNTRPDDGMQTIYGVGTLVVLLHLILGGIIWAIFSVQRPGQ